MSSVSEPDWTALTAAFEAAGQGHVLAHVESLDAATKASFAAELAAVDLDLMAELAKLLNAPKFDASKSTFLPCDVFPLERDAAHAQLSRTAIERGAAELSAGKVGFLLVAGGQASRLGYDGPKGCFPVGPVSGRTLFEIFARRLRAAGERYGFKPTWFVMTSPANDATTRAAFAEAGYFGLPEDDVFFFTQAMLPALDLKGRILLKGPGELFLAPNGHGGTLAALRSSGALRTCAERGIETLSYFQVDNPLAPPADPLFLGLHAAAGADMSSKVVAKADPHEKVGVLGKIDGRIGCIEYSDLPGELREQRDSAGKLVFDAGNIAIHAVSRTFVEGLTEGRLDLPWHVAAKSMEVFLPDGTRGQVDGAKFETFVFDALGVARNSVTLEVDRGTEFSPVKNAEGGDSPATSRRDLCRLHSSWIRELGGPLPDAMEGDAPRVEVDPLLAESLEELRERGLPEGVNREGGLLFDRG